MTNNNRFHQLESEVVTYTKKVILNFVIFSSLLLKQIIESYVEPQFHITSDHKIIISHLELDKPSSKNIGHPSFWPKKMDEKQFVINLEAQKDFIYVKLALA